MRKATRKTNKYPVGARWSYTSPKGDVGTVWLKEICSNGLEIWEWSYQPSSGRRRQDHISSRERAVEECRWHFSDQSIVRFTRS